MPAVTQAGVHRPGVVKVVVAEWLGAGWGSGGTEAAAGPLVAVDTLAPLSYPLPLGPERQPAPLSARSCSVPAPGPLTPTCGCEGRLPAGALSAGSGLPSLA